MEQEHVVLLEQEHIVLEQENIVLLGQDNSIRLEREALVLEQEDIVLAIDMGGWGVGGVVQLDHPSARPQTNNILHMLLGIIVSRLFHIFNL